MSNTIYALYCVVYNSGNECHDLQEPCYYDKAEAVEGFADYIALYNSNSKHHALDYATSIRAGENS